MGRGASTARAITVAACASCGTGIRATIRTGSEVVNGDANGAGAIITRDVDGTVDVEL